MDMRCYSEPPLLDGLIYNIGNTLICSHLEKSGKSHNGLKMWVIGRDETGKLVGAIFWEIFCGPLVRLNAEFFNRTVQSVRPIGLIVETFRPDGVPSFVS
jgi:hypothetical protein